MIALGSEEALDRFLRQFEERTLPKSEWTHAAHLAMAAGYLTRTDVATALPLVRERIRAYNLAVGGENTETAGYHESLTVFWLRVVGAHLAGLDAAMSRLDRVRSVVDAFGGRRDLLQSYWSFDVVKSVEARREWVPPDRNEL